MNPQSPALSKTYYRLAKDELAGMIQNNPIKIWQLTGQLQHSAYGEGKSTLYESFAFRKKLKGDWIVLYFRKQSQKIWLLDSQRRQKVKCSNGSVQKKQRLSWELLKYLTRHCYVMSVQRLLDWWTVQWGHELELMKEYWEDHYYSRISKVSPSTKSVRHICSTY